MSEQHPDTQPAPRPDRPDAADEHGPSPAPPDAAEHRHPRPPAPHAGPGVEPGSDDELDAVSSGPSPTHPHALTDTPGSAHESAHPVPAPPPIASGHPVSPATPHPERWGRVDPDGTVYVRTADGERPVGSWHAGEPAEGLAHYARRFDDVLTEAELLASRLSTSGGADPKHTLASARTLRDSLAEAHVVGDVVGLGALLEGLVTQAEQAVGAQRAERDAARTAAVARKEALAAEAETLAAEATQWKQAGDRFKAILDEWKAIRGVDRKTDGELWKRYATARDTFTRRRGAHFATLDASRKQAQQQKDQLVAEAESLSDSTEWNATATRLKELMSEWKTAPRASKEVEQKLWERFRAAQDAFFTHRSEVFSARDAEQKVSLDKRHDLLVQAEALDIDSDPKAAQAAFREIQGKWHESGRVSRDAAASLDRDRKSVV